MGVPAEYIRSEVEQLRAELSDHTNALEEWRQCVYTLYDHLSAWLSEADGGLRVLGTQAATEHTISEPRLGSYTVKQLWIHLGPRDASVVPRARYVAATVHPPGREPRRADGMLELRYGAAAEYYLFRWKSDAGDEWFIQSATAWRHAKDYGAVEPLDRDRFEAAVLNTLQ